MSTNVISADLWVTAIDVVKHLCVVKGTVYRWRERKGLLQHKIGRLWTFKLFEVDERLRTDGVHDDAENGSEQK